MRARRDKKRRKEVNREKRGVEGERMKSRGEEDWEGEKGRNTERVRKGNKTGERKNTKRRKSGGGNGEK